MNRKRRKKRKTCEHKASHSTKNGAMAAIRKTYKKNFIFHKLAPYKCKFCGKWHIGRTKTIMYEKFDNLIRKDKS